jgi:hypothetical protein
MDQMEVPRCIAISALKQNQADPVDAILALVDLEPALEVCRKLDVQLDTAQWALLNCAGDAAHAARALSPGFDGPISTPCSHAVPWGLASFQGFEERDVDLVAEHAGVSCLAAAWALRDSGGDPSAAVLALARLGLCGGGGAAALLGFCGLRVPGAGAGDSDRDSALALAVMAAADFLDVQPALQLLAAAPGALHLAAAAGAAAAVDALLGAGADAGAKDAAGATPRQVTRCGECARALRAAEWRAAGRAVPLMGIGGTRDLDAAPKSPRLAADFLSPPIRQNQESRRLAGIISAFATCVAGIAAFAPARNGSRLILLDET